MYDYDYEVCVLLVLRLLCFLRKNNLAAFDALIKIADEFDMENSDELIELIMLGEGGLFELDAESEEDYEYTVLCLSHPSINRFLSLSEECQCRGVGGHIERVRKKVQDTVEFYACGTTNSVCHLTVSFGTCCANIRLVLSPDCYAPLELANSVIDMLLYFEQENQRLEKLLKQSEDNDDEPTLDYMEQEAA